MMSTKINTTPLQTEKALQKNMRVEELLFRGRGQKQVTRTRYRGLVWIT